MNLGKVDSFEKVLKEYFSGKTLVSKNGEEFLKYIFSIENFKVETNDVYSFTLVLLSNKGRPEKLETTISFDPKNKKDDIVICSSFNETFSSFNLPEYGDIIKIEEFKNNVEVGMFIDSDGSGDILLKNGSYVSSNLRVNELADLIYHPNVEGIIWYNK